MRRKALIAANWKLNKNISETKDLASALVKGLKTDLVDVIIFPTFTSLAEAGALTKGSSIKLGAQDVSQFQSGAYTGEVSAGMLKELGVEFVLVGHSERRQIFLEDNNIIKVKLEQAFSSGLKVILCCGESLETREANKTDVWVAEQIETALAGLEKLVSEDGAKITDKLAEKLVIAYEPIWAIGTGKTCESQEANRVISFIRSKLANILKAKGFDPLIAEQLRILYGGSVKASTIEEQMEQSDIDGALVGGASLQAEDFLGIVSGAAQKSLAV